MGVSGEALRTSKSDGEVRKVSFELKFVILVVLVHPFFGIVGWQVTF